MERFLYILCITLNAADSFIGNFYFFVAILKLIEGIFCKSSYQIYKPIEICNYVLRYHEGNNSANVYYYLAYPNKIAIKRIRNLKVKQVHFSFVENRRNTEHGVLEKAS